jgi:hypothetical protein
LEKDRLAVGDSTQLEIIFSTKTAKNKVAKSPTIQTNEGPPDKRVRIESHVIDRPDSTYPLIINPYKLDLSQGGGKIVDKIEFNIRNVSDKELNLKLVSVASDFFELDLPESIGPGQTEKGKLTLLKSVLEQSFEKSFTIEVNDDKKSRFTVPVKRQNKEAPQASTSTATHGH